MTEARIIAFPSRPDDRLRLALRSLEAALQTQDAEVAAWRAALREFAGSVRGLDHSVARYRAELEAAGATAAAAGEEARALERRASAWLGQPPG
ncbi:hypothetical protein [Roseicella frigidaeris]|uniref:Uncharacterized protein n=1 Tax=Roseicella frigidaeris TaxID=2230885 RepID=A0A327MAD6_9PROT|nr:hypothetical protein [Roseicella frigidaeris]RAI60261.1 hypothetical protein DOO78_04080 [Roseicella frigidaeris]